MSCGAMFVQPASSILARSRNAVSNWANARFDP
jgi:hypothetical protein